MLSEDDSLLIEHERLRSVFSHAPVTLSVTVLNAILTASVLAPIDGWKLPAGWVAAIVVVSAVRWVCGRRFLSRGVGGHASRLWSLVSVSGALATGVLWGVLGVVLFPASAASQLFLAFVVGGMCAGAVTVSGAHLPTAAAFILPASLPLAASFLAEGATKRVPALMIVIFASALVMISLTAHRTFGTHMRLQEALRREQRKLSDANERLLHEVTQRQTAEATLQQAQKIEAIGHLTGGIAHDFNNLLQVMMGNMNLIQRLSGDNTRITAYAQAAEHAAMRGAELTSTLLTFARRQSLQAVHLDMNTLLREFEPLLLRTLGAMVRFEIVLAPDLPLCQADPAHFQSAVLNLVINARDAMPEGGVLSVATGMSSLEPNDLIGNPEAHPGRFVFVSVSDTGTGMPADVMARVFEPFFTTKEVGKGSGLGLSQVYGFARQSGGHVELDSTPKEGTTVKLLLPASSGDKGAGDDA